MEFTKQQELAVHLKEHDILVSAGAGAGKTRVLVNRMAGRIAQKDYPIGVEEFLVMTFTNAAAAEMKERIGEELKKRLEQDPDNHYLRRQIRMVKSADISTVHSFCNRLLRTHFNQLGIDPSFRIGEEGELFLLRRKAMEDLLEEAYLEKRESFLLLTEAYAPGKSDQPIEEMIEELYRFSRGFPDKTMWFQKVSGEGRQISIEKEIGKSNAMELLTQKAHCTVKYCLEEIARVFSLLQEGEPKRFFSLLKEMEIELLQLKKAQSYEEFYGILKNFSPKDLPRANKQEKECPFLEDIKAVYKQCREEVSNLSQNDFFCDTKTLCMENAAVQDSMEELFFLVTTFEEKYAQLKREKNVYDFDDLEHLALELLVEGYDEENHPIPSKTGLEVSKRYREILVDEYQDTNLVQETILTVLLSSPKNTLFAVGDVKQSIYRFRQARPDLFLRRYDRSFSLLSGEEEEKGTTLPSEVSIELRDNFRSAKGVLYTCNFFFERLMERNFGGVDYSKEIALRAGENGPMAELEETSEVLLLEQDADWESLSVSVNALEAETAMIARRIRELQKEGYEYRDMVILLRSGAGRAQPMVDFLEKRGIPAVGESQIGYFHTREIALMMNYLSIVDNVYQDIPMASVMLSSIGGFSEEDLVQLKVMVDAALRQEYTLYDLMEIYQKEGKQEALLAKVSAFLQQLSYFREKKKETSLHVLLWDIYAKTGFYNEVLLLPDGERRQENLLMLLKKAEDYEKTVFKGLFYFVRYMEQLKSYEIDLGGASSQGTSDNQVRIMTIHKSKGLEFPVVFVSGLSKKFNQMDQNRPVLYHPELGVGMEYVDTQARIHHPSFLKRAIREQMKKDSLEEELRILYVALTRAQKKVILTGILGEDVFEKLQQHQIRLEMKAQARCYLDWILPCLMDLEGFLHHIKIRFASEKKTIPESKKILSKQPQKEYLTVKVLHLHELEEEWMQQEEQKEKITLDQFMATKEMQMDPSMVEKSFSFVYPYQETTLWKRKYSVSELKKLSQQALPSSEGETEVPYDINLAQSEEKAENRRPAFLQEKEEKIAPTARGTIVHKVMELLPFGEISSKEDLAGQLFQIEKRVPSMKQISRSSLLSGIMSFLFSDIGKEIRKMDAAGTLKKEVPFTVGLPVCQVNPKMAGDEMAVVQGVIDCYGKNEEGIWLFDYKTDWILEGEERLLLDRYEKQMVYYKTALEQLLEEKVVHSYLYSFSRKKFIEVSDY